MTGHCFESMRNSAGDTLPARSLVTVLGDPQLSWPEGRRGRQGAGSFSCRFLRPTQLHLPTFLFIFCHLFSQQELMELKAGASFKHPETVSPLGLKGPFKSPESRSSLCCLEHFPHSLDFSFKSPFPDLLTTQCGHRVALAGSSQQAAEPGACC